MDRHHDPEAFTAAWEVEQLPTRQGDDEFNWDCVRTAEPEIADLASHLIAKYATDSNRLRRRVWRGAYLACLGTVKISSEFKGSIIGSVRSRNITDRVYFINCYRDGRLTCQCPDFIYGEAPLCDEQRLCKHLIAFTLTFAIKKMS